MSQSYLPFITVAVALTAVAGCVDSTPLPCNTIPRSERCPPLDGGVDLDAHVGDEADGGPDALADAAAPDVDGLQVLDARPTDALPSLADTTPPCGDRRCSFDERCTDGDDGPRCVCHDGLFHGLDGRCHPSSCEPEAPSNIMLPWISEPSRTMGAFAPDPDCAAADAEARTHGFVLGEGLRVCVRLAEVDGDAALQLHRGACGIADGRVACEAGTPEATPSIVFDAKPNVPYFATVLGMAWPVMYRLEVSAANACGACGEVPVEACDGEDNDCDGATDEGVLNPCGACGDVPGEACDGEDNDCDGATDEGVLNACGVCGGVPVEACDGEDNDCDGATDEGVLNACGACGDVPGEVCDGDDNDCDGATDEGVLNPCGACGAVPAEACNGVDDDCDGTADEGVLNACGACGDVPAEVCGGGDDDCDGRIDERVTNRCGGCGPEPREVCDRDDNDCDGRVDEGVTNRCGECGTEPAEVCDGRDNDCDGRVDERVQNRCGACGPEPREVCDGRDDDCDGDVDEGLLNRCGRCGALPGEVCDGRDNDCDGRVDEGGVCSLVLPRGTACGLGHGANVQFAYCGGTRVDHRPNGAHDCPAGYSYHDLADFGAAAGNSFRVCRLERDTRVTSLPRGLVCGLGHTHNDGGRICEGRRISPERGDSNGNCPEGYTHTHFGDWGLPAGNGVFGCVLSASRTVTHDRQALPGGMACGLSHGVRPDARCGGGWSEPGRCPGGYGYQHIGDWGAAANSGLRACIW